MSKLTEILDSWQEAEDIALEAERIVHDTLKKCPNGGPAPTEIQVEVARKLRETARVRLEIAVKAFRDRDWV